MLEGVFLGDSREVLLGAEPGSISLAVFSTPYALGKGYERGMSLASRDALVAEVVAALAPALRPGGSVAVNVADVLAFPDESLPRVAAEVPRLRRSSVTREDLLEWFRGHPGASVADAARAMGCSTQTVDRRTKGNASRGGKREAQTRVALAAPAVERWAAAGGLHVADRRVWLKDAAWSSSRWASSSARAVDDLEYVFVLRKPGPTTVDRSALTGEEWAEWGSRGSWRIPSARGRREHEAPFPVELPRRLIRLLTAPGDLVADPFCGSGATGEAAALEGRRWLLIDCDQHSARLAASKVAAASRRAAQRSFLVENP